jgi:hypothetical protein
MNSWVDLLLLYLVFGKLMLYYDHVPILLLLTMLHDKIIILIGTWRITRENSATIRVVWDVIG